MKCVIKQSLKAVYNAPKWSASLLRAMLYAAIAYLIVGGLYAIVMRASRGSLGPELAHLPYLCLGLATLVLIWFYYRWRYVHRFYLYNLIGVIAAACSITCTIFLDAGIFKIIHEEHFRYALFSIIGYLLFCVVLCLYHKFKRKKSTEVSLEHVQKSLSDLPPEELREWLKSEEPLVSAVHDFFDMQTIARSLAEKLLNRGGSFALLGKFGSGKSSIVNLIQGYCDNKAAIVFCTISCWGFSDSASALKNIFGSIVHELNQRSVDIEPIRNMPKEYAEAMSSTDTWWGKLAGHWLCAHEHGPDELLENLHRLLKREKRHLILVIEDVDRNESKNFSVQDIFATLHRMKRACDSHYSLILAGLPYDENIKMDYEKLCDYIEYVPKLSWKDKNGVVRKIIRLHHEQPYKEEDISDEVIDAEIKRVLWIFDEDSLVGPIDEAWYALIQTLDTPRKLKHSLRHFDYAWRKLHGECDHFELLVLSVLKYSANDILNYILDHIAEFRAAA